ncbi:MAG TPA: hypothetical protein VGQ36_08625 [Thermoanaerobaculia bacterium]|jgi:hypothetical protein|nr:hypothetical protein [Thermoanaerobaculia bacterium]
MDIKLGDLISPLTASGLQPKQAVRFLEAVSGSIDHELSNRAIDPSSIRVKFPKNETFFTLGVIPEPTLVDSIYASTGMTRDSVRTYLDHLDGHLRPKIYHLSEPIRLEGFGTITPHQGESITYEPIAFEYVKPRF